MLLRLLLLFSLTLPIFSQNALLPPELHKPFLDANGKPLSGGKIYTCVAGASCPGNPLPTFQDANATIQNANPVILDYTGWYSIRLSNLSYKIVAQDRNGVQQWTLDNVTATFPVVPTVGNDASLYITSRCASNNEAVLPAGTFTALSTITPPQGCYIHGQGRGNIINNGATVISFVPTGSALFNLVNDNVHISGLTLKQAGTATAGSVGIYVAGGGSGVGGAAANWAHISDVNTFGFWNGIKIDGGGGSIDLNRVEVDASKSDGIIGKGAQGYWSDIIAQGNTGNGVTIGMCAAGTGCGVGPFQSNIQTFGNGGWGEQSTSQLFISGGNSYFNNDFSGEIDLTSTQADSGYIKDAFVQFAGQSVSFGTNTTAPGIFLSSGAIATVDNVHCFGNQGNCITDTGTHTILSHLYAVGSGQGGTNLYSLQAAASNVTVTDSFFGDPLSLSGNNNTITGNAVTVTSSLPGLEILAGVNQTIAHNNITNSTGDSLKLDSGVTVNDGANTLSGTFTNNGARNSSQSPVQGGFYNQSTSIPTITSASTIAPVSAIALVNGSTDISNITAPAGYQSPTFCTIPGNSATWHTLTGGNIAIGSTAVPNKVLCFYYSSSDGFWRPSY